MDIIEELNELIAQHADYLQVIERAEKQIGKFPSKVIEKVVADYRSLAEVEKNKIQEKVNHIKVQIDSLDTQITSAIDANENSPDIQEIKLLNEIGAISDDDFALKLSELKSNQDNSQQQLLQEQKTAYLAAVNAWTDLIGSDAQEAANSAQVQETPTAQTSENDDSVDADDSSEDSESSEDSVSSHDSFDSKSNESENAPQNEDIVDEDDGVVEENSADFIGEDEEIEEIIAAEDEIEEVVVEEEVVQDESADKVDVESESAEAELAAETLDDNLEFVESQELSLDEMESIPNAADEEIQQDAETVSPFVVSETPPPPPVDIEPVFDSLGVSDIGEEMDFDFEEDNEIQIADEPALEIPDEFAMEDMEFDSIEAIEGPSFESETNDSQVESRSAILLRDEGAPNEAMFSFTGDSYTIGRSQDNDIQIKNDSKVSRHHCKLYKRNGHFYIEDQHSSNGTLINGELISERRLYGGEEIKIGETLFRFRLH